MEGQDLRTKLAPIPVAALGFVWLSLGCLKGPDRDPPAPVSSQLQPAGVDAGGTNTGGTPGTLRQTSPNVTLLEPGVLHSPALPALPAGGYYRIVSFDSPDGTNATFTAVNSTGYGLFAASSPKLVEDDQFRRSLDPGTTLNPVFLDGSKTAGAYNGSNQYLVLRANTGGEPVFLSGYSRSGVPAALLSLADGQSVTIPGRDIPDGNGLLFLNYRAGGETHSFILASVNAPGPTLAVSDATVTEGAGGSANATFTVSLSAVAASNVTVSYATMSGTATAGADFTAASGTLTFLTGETRKTVTVAITGSTARERDVDFFLTLASATNAVITDGVGQGTVRTRTGSRPSRSTAAPTPK